MISVLYLRLSAICCNALCCSGGCDVRGLIKVVLLFFKVVYDGQFVDYYVVAFIYFCVPLLLWFVLVWTVFWDETRRAAKDRQISRVTAYTRPDIWAAPWSSQLRLIWQWHGYNTCPAAQKHEESLWICSWLFEHMLLCWILLYVTVFVLISSQLRCLSSVTLPRWLWWWVCQPEGKHTSPRSSLAIWTGSEWLQRVSSHSETKLNGGMRSSHIEYLVLQRKLCFLTSLSFKCNQCSM